MKVFSENRRARHDYVILETFEAGIALSGHEVKSVKEGMGNIAGSHAIIRGGEVFLVGVEIASFQPKNTPSEYNPGRARKLLLNRKEIASLTGKLQEGLTLVPIALYGDHGLVKASLGLGRGKKKKDKREAIKKRDANREIRKALRKNIRG
jgi:SsrA-binding protein